MQTSRTSIVDDNVRTQWYDHPKWLFKQFWFTTAVHSTDCQRKLESRNSELCLHYITL